MAEIAAHLDSAREAKRRAVDGANARPADRAIDQTEAAISHDALIRGDGIATDPDPGYVEHLGPLPDDSTARAHWIEAAGRVAQHHAIWGTPTGRTFVGQMPTFDNDEDYRLTFYVANQAIHDLYHTVGIPRGTRERQAPGLSF